ncbi:putative glutamine amidotransferase-like proteinC13C5.04 [Ceratocystis lukuohia]|uniref:Glutamine amidotransferase-like proteinC13C5.04 n=1 Tax=Ceratocystis lukuohia TaxID=2019550 RepID=A0ABR4MFR5_9PEZI
MPPFRLAILEADTPMPKTVARSGHYFGVFSELFTSATAPEPLSSVLSLSRYNVHDDPSRYPELGEVDGVLITGSKYNAGDDDHWILTLVAFVSRAMEAGVKVIGVCFGHQIVARALDSPVVRNEKGWEVSVIETELTAEGQRILQMNKMRIFQMHRDIVPEPPRGSTLLSHTKICGVQGLYKAGKYITVQGHPEFTPALVTEVVEARHSRGIFDDDMYQDAMKRINDPQDGVAIAKAFIRFLRNEQ